MQIEIFVATHKSYQMPNEQIYKPLQVGASLNSKIKDYQPDDEGENISFKNPNFCELTGMYWMLANSDADYIGLVHYRRYFRSLKKAKSQDKFQMIPDEQELADLFKITDIILPKKQNYYIETIYSHYSHTHNEEDLRKTRALIAELSPEYLASFDKVMSRKKAHMFNMFIMKKTLAKEYGEWLFKILFALEKEIDLTKYDTFHARLFGRISEMLLDVWLDYHGYDYRELPVMYMEKINWPKKIASFLKAKFFKKKYEGSF